MKRTLMMATLTLMALMWLVSSPAPAQDAADAPPAATAPAAVEVAPQRPAGEATAADAAAQQASPEAMAILDRLERAGEAHHTIRADVTFELENAVLGDREARTGWLAYQIETPERPARIRIHFDTLRLDAGPRVRERVDYAFDGEWATVARETTRTMELYQVAPPGQQVRALKLGEGPLPPLPFGQKAEDVLRHFEPSTRPLGPGEPAGTTYLRLETRPAYREDLSFTWLEMWIAADNDLPVRIVAMERNRNLQTVELRDVKTNDPVRDDLFRMSERGWRVERHRYEERAER